MGLLDRLELLASSVTTSGFVLERHAQRGPRLGDEQLQDLRVDRAFVEEALQNVGGALLELEDAVLEDVLEEAQPALLLDVQVELRSNVGARREWDASSSRL